MFLALEPLQVLHVIRPLKLPWMQSTRLARCCPQAPDSRYSVLCLMGYRWTPPQQRVWTTSVTAHVLAERARGRPRSLRAGAGTMDVLLNLPVIDSTSDPRKTEGHW